ncbi:hypothetical protein F511_35804 [Dorcoceras hygrometricum]|uniref:Uncharacterized protein n=1 Tax=Dorcoceras hygrometricum TaxID=472368 RepID=A0A2Z7C6M5_9LAMI|nr:hypothetical protein F511_35804 [Dorcoceras hygrometricum]
MKRRRAGESADELVLMMSSVMSSYSADGLRRAVARISRCYLKIAIAKRCRLHKLIRQRFALALKIQQEDFALINQSQDPVASYSGSRRKQQQHPVESLYEPAVAINSVASFAHPVAS